MSASSASPSEDGAAADAHVVGTGDALQWSLFCASMLGLAALLVWSVRHPVPIPAPTAPLEVATGAAAPAAPTATVPESVPEPEPARGAEPVPPPTEPEPEPTAPFDGGAVVVVDAPGGRRIALGAPSPAMDPVPLVPASVGAASRFAPPDVRASDLGPFPAPVPDSRPMPERVRIEPPMRVPVDEPEVAIAVEPAVDAEADTEVDGEATGGIGVPASTPAPDAGREASVRAEELAVLAGLSERLRYAPGESFPGATGDDALQRMVEPLTRYPDVDIVVSVSGRELSDPARDAALARERAARVIDRLVGLGLYRGRFLIRLRPDASVPVAGQHVRVAARGIGPR